MRQRFRNIRLIAVVLLLEAWRRREIYVIVFVTTLLIIGLRFVHFFDIEGLSKFYREIGLRTMNVTAALTVILLAARQLPREFTHRTIYPLLAKPVARWEFLLGKFFGVVGAGVFCYALFMAVFAVGSLTLSVQIDGGLFAQAIFLQVLSLMVLASLVFPLSMLLNADAAVTIAAILYVASQVMLSLMSYLYDYVDAAGRWVLLALHLVLPQLTLLDASARVVHSYDGASRVWGPLPWSVVGQLTLYSIVYIVAYLWLAHLLFKRRPL